MGGVVTGGEDRMVALDAGDVGAGQFVGTLDNDAVDMGIGIEHVDSHKVVVGRRNFGMLAWSRPSTVTPAIVTSASPLTVTTAYLFGRPAFDIEALATSDAASGDSMMVWSLPAP